MMLNIYIARHGQNVDNANHILNGHRDKELTDLGIAQAHEVADKIKTSGLHFDAVLCSPLIRAVETAKIISTTTHSPEPVITPGLIERNFGCMTGVKQSKIEELCAPEILKTDTVTYFLSPEGAETFPDLLKRAKSDLMKIKDRYKSGNVLVVTHGDFGKMLYASYYNLGWEDVLRQFHFGNSELIILSPSSSAEEAHVFSIEQHNL